MLDVALSLVFAPDLPPEEIEREKFVVLQEIGEAADDPDDMVMELAQTASFPDHPLGLPILGVEATLKSITRDDLISFAADTYAPHRTVVSVAGAFDRAAIEAVAQRWLAPRAAQSQRNWPAPAAPVAKAATHSRKLEQTHLVLAHPGPQATSPERFAARIFAEIFGGGMASRLFQEVRESRGLAYTIDASAEQYSDAGRLSVFAGCAPADAAEVVNVTRSIWAEMAASGPTEQEMSRARAVAAASYAMSAEAPAARAGSAAYELLAFDKLISIEQVLRLIDSVTDEDVRRIAAAALAGPAIAAAVGPKAGLAAAEAFVSARS
jgi:predicted Zn-dependent peptidase